MTASEDVGETKGRGRSWRDVDLRAVAPFAALALLLIVGALVNPNFIGLNNLANVATRSAFIAIIAVGATFVISSGDLDLSVGAMVAFVASLMILFMNSGAIADPSLMLTAAIVLTVVIGAGCGLLNGLITTVGKIEPFIATLGTMGIYRGLTTWLSQGGWEVSAKLMYNIKGGNDDFRAAPRAAKQKYDSGDDFHMDYLVGRRFGPWGVGLSGYYLKQTGDDKIDGKVIDALPGVWSRGRRGEVLAAGPSLTSSTKGGTMLIAQWQHEFERENRFGGDKALFKLVMPF